MFAKYHFIIEWCLADKILPQNGTDWHRCNLRGCSSLCCTNQASGILPQIAQNTQKFLAERSSPSY